MTNEIKRNREKEIVNKKILIVAEDEKSSRKYIGYYLNYIFKENKNYIKNNYESFYNKDIDLRLSGNLKSNFTMIKTDIIKNKIICNYEIKVLYSKDNSTRGIVERTKKEIKNYDLIYCVFDHDYQVNGRDEQYKNALNDYNTGNLNEKIKLANSSPFFEIFILLHFEYTTSLDSFGADKKTFNKNVTKYLNQKYKLDYSKGMLEGVFDNLKDKIQVAIKNSKRLNKEEYETAHTNFYKVLEDLIEFICKN